MEILLTICISSHNDSDFVLNTLYCLEKITKNPYKVIIRDNDSDENNCSNLKKNVNKYPNVHLYRVENLNLIGSMAHGTSLNDLYKKIDTKYGVILDADCTFLYKNWDEILISKIDKNTPIIGTQSTPSINEKRKHDFPYMFGILFITEIMKKLQIDFRPDDPKINDTGFELREKYLKNGYRGKLLIVKNTRNYKFGPFRNIICAEYYLDGYKNIFASHFGRGGTLGKNKYLNTRFKILYAIPILGSYLLRFKGLRDKKKWIKICKTIVNSY